MHKFPWMQKVHPLSYLMGYAEGQGPWWRARQGRQQGLNWSSFHEIHHNSPLSGCRHRWDTSMVKTMEPEHKLAGSFFHVFGLSPQLNIPWNVGNDEKKERCFISTTYTFNSRKMQLFIPGIISKYLDGHIKAPVLVMSLEDCTESSGANTHPLVQAIITNRVNQVTHRCHLLLNSGKRSTFF